MDLDKINYELNIQKSNLLLLKEYLNKMNNLIQDDDSYDNSFKFMEMLKELKINMDNTKSNISNLTVLRTLLINLQINSESNSNDKSDEEIKQDLAKDTSIEETTDDEVDFMDFYNINLDAESTDNSNINLSEVKPEQDNKKSETSKSNEDSNVKNDSEELIHNNIKSQEQIVANYYEECFEILEKNFVVFYAFLLNYINSCTLSEEYYLSELSKEKQNAIEFIQNELMEKDITEQKEEKEKIEKIEENEEKQKAVEEQVKEEKTIVKKEEKNEELEEILITNKSTNEEDEDDYSIGTLIISEKDNKVILPYNEDDIKKLLDTTTEYTSLEQIIDDKYTIPLERYKNPALSRFRETYNLMKKRQKASMADSLDLALELAFNSSLNPAIITACKNLEQLDSYLTCAELNELDKFEYFKIKYEVSPMKK